MSFIKVAKTNYVVIKLLLSGHKEESKVINEYLLQFQNKLSSLVIFSSTVTT